MMNSNLHQKNIFITGGTGFIGKHLSKLLLDNGAFLTILSRRYRNDKKFLNEINSSSPNLKFTSSISDLNIIKPDIIINLAGETISQRWTINAKKRIYDSRINTTKYIAKYIDETDKKPSCFISGSAVGYYGTSQNNEFDDNMNYDLLENNSFAQTLCRDWENSAKLLNPKETRSVILRIGPVIDSSGGLLKNLILPFKLGLGGMLGNGEQWLSWIDLEDLISLIIFAIENPDISGALNATSPSPVTNKVFSNSLCNLLKRPCKFPYPSFLLKILFGEMAEEIMLKGQKTIPSKALAHGFVFKFGSIEESLKRSII